MKKFTLVFSLVFVGLSMRAQDPSANTETTHSLNFKENKGQVSDQFYNPRPDVLFSGTTRDMAFHLRNTGISYQMQRVDSWEKKESPLNKFNPSHSEKQVPSQTTIYRLDIDWVNCNSQAQVEKGDALAGYDNYYLASCPEGAVNVKSYTSLLYKNIYPGIDLKWYEKNGNLKYDYYVSANTDYKNIQLQYKGADRMYVDRSGELIIETPLGIIKEQKPLVTQNNKTLNARWIVKNNIASFEIKNADPSLPLLIDPMIRLWGSYYGGSGSDETYQVHTDIAGNVYMSGGTSSVGNISTIGAHQITLGNGANGYDAFLVKFNSSGVRQWATYYGGTGNDFANECNTDASGNIYMSGDTESSNPGVIATPGAHQTTYSAATSNQSDGFLVVFNSAGVRQWGTYYGGDKLDAAYGISLDNSGNIYITGLAQSTTGIATPGSHQPGLLGLEGCFLAKFNPAGVRQWATYYGADASGRDCLNNPAGDIYVAGIVSTNTGIATPSCHQPVYGGGTSDGFYAKFNTNGVLQWGTYYGGGGYDQSNTLSLDASGNVYGGGNCANSTGTVIATPGSYQPVYGGGLYDAYAVKFDPAGTRLWGTYYGGSGVDAGGASVDVSGNIYIWGSTSTSSGTAIATPCAYQAQYGGGSNDLFFAKLTPAGSRVWGTYYGSMFTEGGVGFSPDLNGNVYICGVTFAGSGTVMASSNGHQPSYGGGGDDAVLAKFDGCIPGTISNLTPPANLLVCNGNTTTLSATCGKWYTTPTSTVVLGTGGTFTAGPIVSDSTFYVEDFGCGVISATRTAISLTLAPSPTLAITNSNPSACVSESIALTVSGASTYSWVNNAATTSSIQVFILLYTSYTVQGVDLNGCKSSATIAINPQLCLGIKENGIINSSIQVFPNPNRGAFTIHSGQETKLILTDELGQVLKTLDLSPANNYQVVLEGLADGIYFLTNEKQNGNIHQKIIVLH